VLLKSIENEALPMKSPSVQERCARWLLLLTLLHTVPVIWITPVAAGTAPAVALLAVGLASLFNSGREGIAIALFVLGPALLYSGLAWLLAWYLARRLRRIRQPVRVGLLAMFTVALLLSVYFPIYSAGSHNGTRSARLGDLVGNTIDWRMLIGYWIVLHVVLVALYSAHLLRDEHPVLGFIERWRKPASGVAVALLCAAMIYGNYPNLICRPLAELGSGRAALCVAQSDRGDKRYWYERAAEKGQTEAIVWMSMNARDRDRKLYWLRQGAERGVASIQFELYQRLTRLDEAGATAESERWLRRSAEGGHVPAQMIVLDALTQTVYRSKSTELLAERNGWLERAARLGARDAKRQLAEHHTDGSMGYAVDMDRARGYYRELARLDKENNREHQTRRERLLGLDAGYYAKRIAELDAWETGLKDGDPAVTKLLAKRYLKNQFPGPGVRERGLQMMEQLAANGDAAARNALIVNLRTGSGGVEKDTGAAKTWLITAAQAGDVDAMERVARNYAKGREGFAVDYPEAKRWFRSAIETRSSGDADDPKLRSLRSELTYIDRLAEHAGGTLLGERKLGQLGRRSDAESSYQYAIQLLAGHGPERRAEAVERLHEASRHGHGPAAWRLVQIYERGYPAEIDKNAAVEQLKIAAANHHFDATRELAMRYEHGMRGLPNDLPRAITLYEDALAAGHDNRYGWDLDPGNYNHFKWLESRLRQARNKLNAQVRK
jgi:TPR repeat protein